MTTKLRARKVMCLLLTFLMCLGLCAGCHEDVPQQTFSPSPAPSAAAGGANEGARQTEQERFDSLLDELFAEIVAQDSITLNYFVADPSLFGIEPMTPTYGQVVSQEYIERDREDTSELCAQLESFKYEDLRPDQQVTYDILNRYILLFEEMDKDDDFYYYLGDVHPVSGIQVQLPVLLAEFNFRSAGDIETYLQLLGDTLRYFEDLIEFERERSRRGFFMSDANVDEVVANCESFVSSREDNLLIVVFDDKIDAYPGLSSDEREGFKQRNRELVLDNVLAAYDALIAAMRELRGQGANQKGLASLPSGREYAGYLLQSITGSDKMPEEVDALLAGEMNNIVSEFYSILSRNPDVSDAYNSGVTGIIPEQSPLTYLTMLEEYIARDFPAIEAVRYVVNETHESLQEFISPAFYLAPAIDDYYDNVIYVNPAQLTTNISLFTTLAHEGYPGHLYQNVYFLQQSQHPLRRMISTLGYTEGWATYVEMWSYYQAGLSDAEAALLQNDQLYSLTLLGRIDLGVNALGWGYDDTAAFLVELGYANTSIVDTLINMVMADPLSYLPYCLGYYEFKSLLEEAERALKNRFELIEFHRFVLDIGPAPFTLIREHMQAWIEAQGAGVLGPAA